MPADDKIKRRVEHLKANPSNRRASELIALLRAVGATETKKSGSHHVFKYKGMLPTTLVHHSEKVTLKPETVLDKIRWIEELLERQEAES